METIEKTMYVLNDLIDINLDREAGFEKAGKNLENGDTALKTIFNHLAGESRNNSTELAAVILQHGAKAETLSSAAGAIYRNWIEVRATFSGYDRKSILEECERSEDAIGKAYQSALAPDNGLNLELVALVRRQKAAIDAGHGQIKAYQGRQ